MKNENILLIIALILILLFLISGCSFVLLNYGSCTDGLKYGYSIFGKTLFILILGLLALTALALFIYWLVKELKKE